MFATLQDKGWAMSNSAGTGTTYPDFSLFEASVALTEEGLENWEKVVEIIYSQVRYKGGVVWCYVMSCHVISCHVMSCHVMSCHVMSCHVMSCHVMSCHIM